MYKEIEVFDQAELDAVPADFHGRILIKFGARFNRAVLRRKFEYKIGETVVPKYPMDTNPREDCGSGIHASHKAWCVDYGGEWDDLAILEVEMPMASMVVPVNGSGKVRADRATVIREVPLEECGLLGKMLAQRRSGV